MNINDIRSEGVQQPSTEKTKSSLPSRQATPTEEKTEDEGINVLSTGEEGNHQVFIPQDDLPHSTVQNPELKEEVIDQGIEDVMEEIESRHEHEQTVEERTPALAAIDNKWLGFMKDLNNQTIYDMIKERRSEILKTKNDYLDKQMSTRQNRELLASEIDKLEQKIANSSDSKDISLMKQKLNSLKVEQSFIGSPEKEIEVKELMKVGKIAKLGGKSGVYSLSGIDGKPKFIIKPMDEEIMTLNNPKGYALPHSVKDAPCEAKSGIPSYSALTNGELGYLIAKELGLEDITPRCYVMPLTSDQFADLTDGMEEEEKQELIKNGGTPDWTKLCIVQEFIPDCKELGAHVLSSSGKTREELENLSQNERDNVIIKTLKEEIDPSQFDKVALLCWVTGEKDGNGGNFLISELNSETNLRSIYKIDCAASSPEDNINMDTGLSWAGKYYHEDTMSENLKVLINNINPDNIASIMRSRNKSEDAINAMKDRVATLKRCANDKEENWIVWWVDQELK